MTEWEFEQRITESLERAGHLSRLKIVKFRFPYRQVVLRCPKHGIFSLQYMSVVDTEIGGKRQRSKGCPHCEGPGRGVPRHLGSMESLTRRAREFGVEPNFNDVQLTLPLGLREWRCVKHPEQTFKASFGKIRAWSCPACKGEANREALLLAVRTVAASRGDMVTRVAEGALSDDSKLEFRCSKCKTLVVCTIEAFLAGKEHACGRPRQAKKAAARTSDRASKRTPKTTGSKPTSWTGSAQVIG